MNEHLAWAKGGAASFTAVKDDEVTLRSTIPSPPGSRLQGLLAGDPPEAVTVKIHGSKLEPDGWYTLRGKLLVASRPLRDRVAALVT